MQLLKYLRYSVILAQPFLMACRTYRLHIPHRGGFFPCTEDVI